MCACVLPPTRRASTKVCVRVYLVAMLCVATDKLLLLRKRLYHVSVRHDHRYVCGYVYPYVRLCVCA